MIIVSDTHLGLRRSRGATPASMAAFYQCQIATLQALPREPLLIPGDLFAAFDVDTEHLLAAWMWLKDREATVLQGNHDISKDRSRLSSLDFLAQLLPGLVVVKEPCIIGEVAYVPHLANQQEYDAAVFNAANTATILVTHANFENPWAVEQDHSLNLTQAQAVEFDLVLSGHEHNRRVINNVHMLGSPWPCNIAEAGVDHFIHEWDGENAPAPIPIWSAARYEEQDWRSLGESEADFVRVVGEADAGEAALVIQEINRFRGVSKAFFISSSVKVGELDLGELEEAEQSLDGFDPVAALMSVLSPENRTRLEQEVLND